MALTKNFLSDRAKQVRRNAAGSQQGCGDDRHALIGSVGTGTAEYRYRSLTHFVHNWSDVKRVVKIELALKVEDDSTHFTYGGKPKVRVERITNAWTDGANAENVWSAGEYEWPPSAASPYVDAEPPKNPDGTVTDEAWFFIDVTQVMKGQVPKTVLMPDGTPGAGYGNHGLLLRTPGNELDNNQRSIFHSWHNATAANRPYLKLTYDPLNRAPSAPTLTGPATTNVTFGDSFEGDHADPDLDPLASREIIVYIAGGSTVAWTLPANLQAAGSDETQTGHFSVPLSLAAGSLKSQTDYEWVARTRDPSGAWGPYSARRALRITSSAPSVVATNVTTVAQMASALFGGTYTDPDNNPLGLFQIQMRSVAAHSDVSFADPALIVWDTGESIPSQAEITAKRIQRPYAGQSILLGDYTYRIRVRDSTGVWSAWSYDNFHLNVNYDIDPGNVELTTQVARNAPVRIALYRMGTLRAPGALIGHIDDPMDLGASAYLNGGGEIYFTLPALHPYCPSIEPHSTHYAIEQWYGDRYRVLFAGIITDFDAVADEMVAYGTDYLGLLQTAVDERFNPNKTSENAPVGSHYTNLTVDAIIRDQLTYHKGLPNSPIGFITIPSTGASFSALAERVTIDSTYAEALPFISGLIDSHKQGTGREARFYARPKDTTYLTWEWALVDPWGKDRRNIVLEYGGLLNDFRIVALGDFGTRVLGVGQRRNEAKVYRATGTGGLDEALWGRRAKTRFYQDIYDQNDLQRRVNEDAAQLAKVGKRMALAIQADMLSPFDGWDLGDSIVINIVRGVVDTSRYGSEGLWTIYGVEWRYHPDGHSDLNLTILPKKGLVPPNPDLIPSINPGVPDQWQTGYGVPTVYGVPPSPTPPPPALLAASLNSPSDTWRYRTGLTAPTDGQLKFNPADTQVLVSKTADSGFSRAAELLELVIGSLIRIRSQGGLDRVGKITAAADSGSYVTLDYDSLLSVGALPPQNSPLAVNAKAIGTYSFIPPSSETVQAKHYEDLNTGCVYELDEGTGIYSEVFCPTTGGGVSPTPPDTTPPPVPTIRTPLSSVSVQQDDGTTVTIIAGLVGYDAPTAGTLTDLQSIVVESSRYVLPDLSGPDWTLATQWIAATPDKTGTVDTSIVQPAVLSATHYWWRAYAVDQSGNKSGASALAEVDTATDTIGPPPPSGIVLQPGHTVFGVRWDRINADDMAYTEVRWRESPAGAWISVRVGGTITVIAGVTNEVVYDVQLRSVDRSGNTDTGTVDGSGNPIYAKVESNPEAGWVSAGTVTPTALEGGALVWDSAMIEDIFAGEINADWITSGTIRAGNAPALPDPPPPSNPDVQIEVYDATGQLIGRWGVNGIELFDPANDGYKMILDETGLVIYSDYGGPNETAVVTLSPNGIDAASITFGSARGGHNLIQNSSFELGAFGVTVVTTSTWDVLADWNAGRQGSDTNITVGASALTMTSVT